MLTVFRRFPYQIWPLGALLLVLSPGTAFGQTSDAKSQPLPYPSGITCVWMPNLRSQSYSLIDDQHLVIEGTGRKYYLLTLSRRCWDLDTSLDIGISQKGQQLCTGDSIITDNDRCMIRYLEPVTNFRDAKSIVQARDAAEKAARQRGRTN